MLLGPVNFDFEATRLQHRAGRVLLPERPTIPESALAAFGALSSQLASMHPMRLLTPLWGRACLRDGASG